MAALPRGTATFLFTDIEGSTQRWEHTAAAIRPAVERHVALLRKAAEAQGATVFRGQSSPGGTGGAGSGIRTAAGW